MEFYDVRIVESESLSLQLENGALEKPRHDFSVVKSFRVLKNGFWGFFEGNVSDEEGIRRAEKNAVFKSNSEVVELKSEGHYEMRVKQDPRDVPIEEKVQLLKDLEKILQDVSVSTKVSYFENVRRFQYRDSFGSEVSYIVFRTGISILAVGKGKTLQFYSQRLMKAGGYEVLKDAASLAENVAEILPKLVDAEAPPAGKMNVIMDPKLAGVFIHEAFGHAVEADHVLQGSTILAGKIGEKVAHESVTICDDPSLQEFGFCPFDDEGVATKRKIIVENGILKSYLHSRETAKKLDGEAGNARAQGGEFPIVRMSNTYLEPSDYSFDELLEECKDGVYLVGSRGGETNPATGYFQFNAQYGYVVKNGEIREMIRDVSLSGHTLEILRNIRIGKDISFDPGFCGKAFQYVPVSDGAPHVLCKAVVGGA